MRLFLGLVFTLWMSFFQAQQVDSRHCDCENALFSETGEFPSMTLPTGYGKRLEIKGQSIRNQYVPTREHNVLWIRFQFATATMFEFQLTPSVGSDDFDFSLWKANGDNYCDSIRRGVLPIRSNLARRNPDQGSITGLKSGFTNEYAKAGPNPSFSAPVNVDSGEVYYLLIDAPYGTNGPFETSFNYERYAPVVEVEPEPIPEPKPLWGRLVVRVLDEHGNKMEHPIVKAKGLHKRDSLYLSKNGDHTVSRIHKFTNYLFDINKKNYLEETRLYMGRNEKDDDTILVQMRPLELGSKLQFKDVLFVSGKAEILKSSERDLKRIRNFLLINDHIYVEIMGHVNGVRGKQKEFQALSDERAQAILDYLVGQGVSENRLTANGYGAKEMIYKKPQNEDQAKVNRRVEIKVTKL